MTGELIDLLFDLLSLPGVSGREGSVAARLKESWGPLVDDLHLDRLGNLIATRRGFGREPRPKLLITAHMDSIGFIVRGFLNGFPQIDVVGRMDQRILPGQTVTLHGTRDLPGVIVAPPSACLPAEVAGGVVPLEYLLLDLGLAPVDVRRAVKVGDIVSFDRAPLMLSENVICGHSLDNRASLAALTLCLQALAEDEFDWDLAVAATVQEETTFHGAHTSAEAIDPNAVVVVDVTYGRAHADGGNETFPIGDGPTNAWSPEVHPAMYAEIESAAERAGVRITRENLPTDTGTEARGVMVAGAGKPLGLISIPLRYMHSPIEVVHLSDIRQTARVLSELVSSLSEGSLEHLALA